MAEVTWHSDEVTLTSRRERFVRGKPIADPPEWLTTPTVCDLSSDPLACAILRCWARQPWAEVHRCALVDRMIELGHEAQRGDLDRLESIAHVSGWRPLHRGLSRRKIRRILRAWKANLIDAFGRFE